MSEDFHSLIKATDIQSHKKFVVWVERIPNKLKRSYKTSIHLLNKDTGKIKQFTSGIDDNFPRFSPNGEILAFISKRSGKAQVFLIDLDGGEASQISKFRNGVTSLNWSPDSSKIAITANVNMDEDFEENKGNTELEKKIIDIKEEYKSKDLKDPMVIRNLVYRTGTSYKSEVEFSHVFILKLKNKGVKRITDGEFNYSEIRWVDNDNIITVAKRESPVDTNFLTQLIKFNVNTCGLGEVVASYNKLYFPSLPEYGFDRMLVNLDHEREKPGQNNHWGLIVGDETITINKSLDRSIDQLKVFEDHLLCLVEDSGKADVRLYSFADKIFKELIRPDFSVESFAGDKNELYLIGTDPNHPSAIWRWDGTGISLIKDVNFEFIVDAVIVEPEEFWLENEEGVKFQGWFFDAGLQNGQKPALILSIHGGPHVMWNNAASMWHEWQVCLSRGYSILAVNPIGSSGYGEEFSQLITARWGLEDARDLLQSVDHFIDRVNPERLYLTGGSYAGFQVANIISRDHRFKAACAQRGVFNLTTFWSTTDIPIWGLWEMETTPWENLDLMWDLSPVARVKEINTPLLIIHSENDYRVSVSQAEELFASLRLDNKETELVRYPRDGHELSRSGEPFHVVDRIERILDWFDKH